MAQLSSKNGLACPFREFHSSSWIVFTLVDDCHPERSEGSPHFLSVLKQD